MHKGFDPVAYFSEGRAVEGREDFAHVWQDARWLFASPEHRDRFAADPEAYDPNSAAGAPSPFPAAATPPRWTPPTPGRCRTASCS